MAHRISVIIPCHNGGAFLPETLQSVLAQTRKADEIIVVNDGSTDQATLDLLASLPTQIQVVHKSNEGLGLARNSGIEASAGDLLLMLDDDDLIAPECLAKMEVALDAHPEASWVGCQIENFGVISELATPPGYNPFLQLHANHHACTALFRRAVFEGLRYPRMLGFEDWSLWLSCAERGLTGHLIDEPLFRYRRRGHGSLLHASELARHELLASLREQHPGLFSSRGQARLKARWAPGLELLHAPQGQEQLRAFVQGQSLEDVVLTATHGCSARELLSIARGKFIAEVPSEQIALLASALPSFLEQVVRIFAKAEYVDAVAVPTEAAQLGVLIRSGVHCLTDRLDRDDLVFVRTHRLADLTAADVPADAPSTFLFRQALEGRRTLRLGKDFFRQLHGNVADPAANAQLSVEGNRFDRTPSDLLPPQLRGAWKHTRALISRSLGEAEAAALMDTVKLRLHKSGNWARRARRVGDALLGSPASNGPVRGAVPGKLLSAHRRQELLLLDQQPLRFERLTRQLSDRQEQRILLLAPSLSDCHAAQMALQITRLIRTGGQYQVLLLTHEPSSDHLASLFSPQCDDLIDLDRIIPAHGRTGFIAQIVRDRSISAVLMFASSFAFEAARALKRSLPRLGIAAFWDNDAIRQKTAAHDLRGVDLHVFSSESTVRRIGRRKLGKAELQILPPWCELDDFDPNRTSPGWVHARLRLPRSVPLVGAIEPLEQANKPLVLARVFGQLRGRWSDPGRTPHFVFVGSGSMQELIRGECARIGLRWNTHFLAADMPRPEILHDLNLAVWSSSPTSVPPAVLQAMAMTVPVVAPHSESFAEVITPETGVLVRRLRDQDRLADQLFQASLAILEDEERSREMGRQGRQRAVSLFGDSRARRVIYASIGRLLSKSLPLGNESTEVNCGV